jgi:hypothetical protein
VWTLKYNKIVIFCVATPCSYVGGYQPDASIFPCSEDGDSRYLRNIGDNLYDDDDAVS